MKIGRTSLAERRVSPLIAELYNCNIVLSNNISSYLLDTYIESLGKLRG